VAPGARRDRVQRGHHRVEPGEVKAPRDGHHEAPRLLGRLREPPDRVVLRNLT
jgi:hypothetical protein